MSFGFSLGDAIVLTQLASRAVQNSRKACGAHDELTQEITSLKLVLGRLKDEAAKAESPINRPGDSCREELQSLVVGSKKVLKVLENILVKYNSLSQEERSGRKLWQRIRFGNGEMQDLAELRAKLTFYTSALSLFLNMVSVDSIGRVEKRMDEAGGDLREIRLAVNGITAHLLASKGREGSVLTTYAEDDRAVWKELRRELVMDGFSSSTIRKHKELIKAYMKELAERGLLDEVDPHDQNGVGDGGVQAAVGLSKSGKNLTNEFSPNDNTAGSVLENWVQAYANRENLDHERRGQESSDFEAEDARLRAEEGGEEVQSDAKEARKRNPCEEKQHTEFAENIQTCQDFEGVEREQTPDPLERLHFDDTTSLGAIRSASAVGADLDTMTLRSDPVKNHLKDLSSGTGSTQLQHGEEARNSGPPPWLHDDSNYYVPGYDAPSDPAYVFVAAPYGICLVAPLDPHGKSVTGRRGYVNVSLMCWHFLSRIELINSCLAAPDVCRLLNTDAEGEAPIPRTLDCLRGLRIESTKLLTHIVPSEIVVMTDDYCLVSCFRSLLYSVMKETSKEEALVDFLRGVVGWLLHYEVGYNHCSALTAFTRIRQWSDLTKLDTKAMYECLPSNPSGIYSNHEPWETIESDPRPEIVDGALSRDALVVQRCESVEAYMQRTRRTWSKFRPSLASTPKNLHLKLLKRYYYIKIAPLCRGFISGVPATDCKKYKDTLIILQNWVKEDYVTSLNHLDVQDGSNLEKVRHEALGEVKELSLAITAKMDTLKAFTRLATIERLLRSELKPKCVSFVSNPPGDAKHRRFEHKKLSEVLLSSVIIELDAVETIGDTELIARKRKELIWETQALLGQLDAILWPALNKEPSMYQGGPIYIKVNRKHMDPETLDLYELPWEVDAVSHFNL